MNKLKNTNLFKHKHNISNTIAQVQVQIQKIQNQNSIPNQDIETNIARISISFKIFSISSIFLLTKHKITKKKTRSVDKSVCLRWRKKKRKSYRWESGDVGGESGKRKKFFFFLVLQIAVFFEKHSYRSPFKKLFGRTYSCIFLKRGYNQSIAAF